MKRFDKLGQIFVSTKEDLIEIEFSRKCIFRYYTRKLNINSIILNCEFVSVVPYEFTTNGTGIYSECCK